ncbi:MAG: N-carbamoylputrescine amidase, partial [Acetanaerobacterium sp.]
ADTAVAKTHTKESLMRRVTIAATQMISRGNAADNIAAADELVRSAHARGANIILLQELFETDYFCQKPLQRYIPLATTVQENPAIRHFSAVARELGVVLPISFFERCNNAYYNTLAVIDTTGEVLGIYRKSHIPDGFGYQEKFFFNPGDTGFRVWNTQYGAIGCGVCWDQWFPEAARIMALEGAELLLYPTAIGSEPQNAGLDSRQHWQTCMRGHAAANLLPVIASNRIGTEREEDSSITFYGTSFITDHTGAVAAQADDHTEGVITASFDLDELALFRRSWGVFRDRRPDLYTPLLTHDGSTGI